MTAIPTDSLLDYIPPRPPMVWVDRLLKFGPDGGIGVTVVNKNALYMTDNELRSSACMEFVAQTYAFNNAAVLKAAGAPVDPNRRAFLAAINDFKILEWPTFPEGAELITEVKKERQFGLISIITGRITWGDTLIATGELKVYSS